MSVETRRGHQLSLGTGVVKHPLYWEFNPSRMEEQIVVLTIELSLQLLFWGLVVVVVVCYFGFGFLFGLVWFGLVLDTRS